MSVAFVAAYMLVLQGLLGAFAVGAASASPMLDTFGNPLCVTSGETTTSKSGFGHETLPDCCTIACSMFGKISADDRPVRTLFNPLRFSTDDRRIAFEGLERGFAPQCAPGSPRSPPLMV